MYFVVSWFYYYSIYSVNLLMLLWMCVWLWMLSTPYLFLCACIYMHVHQHIFIATCQVKHLTPGNKDVLSVNDQNSAETIILHMWMSAMHFTHKWNHQEAFWLDSTLPLKPTSSGYSGLPQTVMATVGYHRQWSEATGTGLVLIATIYL